MPWECLILVAGLLFCKYPADINSQESRYYKIIPVFTKINSRSYSKYEQQQFLPK